MSKAVNDNQVEPKELKALCLIGPGIDPAPEVLELYNREDCAVIGNGIDDANIEEIHKELKKYNVRVGPNTRIDISAHSDRVGKEHNIWLDKNSIKTKDFFKQLQELSPITPLYIHLWSCFGGTANKDIEVLNPGSTIVTHIKSQYTADMDIEDFSLLHSLTRYLNEKNLTPHLQYLYDQLENYQATTFNQKESDGSIIKFKTIHNLADNSIIKKFSQALQKNISEEILTQELQEYLAFEGSRFCELFKDYLSISDIGNFHDYISNVTNENMKDFVSGMLINLIKAFTNEQVKDKGKILTIVKDIVSNLNSELINHNFLGMTPLIVAVENNNLEMVKILLEIGANPNSLDTRDSIDGCTILNTACVFNHIEIANLLLEFGADPNHLDSTNSTPLVMACDIESIRLVKTLLAKGADPNHINKDNLTPLIIACFKSSEAITKALLENKADPNLVAPAGPIPLIIACSKDSNAIIQNLLNKGANPNAVDNKGNRPLLAAYKENFVQITEFLLQSKAEPNIIDPKTGNTILHNAYNDGKLKIFQLLINYKADCNLPNIDGTTILMAACEKGDLETAKLLLKHGADINMSSVKGDTPLFSACKNGNLELVKLLVENGANLEIQSISIAEQYGHTKVKAFLETEINSQKILNKLDKKNPPPPKPPRLPKLQNLNKGSWVSSVNVNSTTNQPQRDFFQSNRGAENKLLLKEVNYIINTAIESVDKISSINDATRKEIKNILTEELQKIPINDLIVNKKGITNLVAEELKLNNQGNNNVIYKTSQESLREIGNRISTKYIYPIQTVSTNTHKWQSFVKPYSKDNYKGRG